MCSQGGSGIFIRNSITDAGVNINKDMLRVSFNNK